MLYLHKYTIPLTYEGWLPWFVDIFVKNRDTLAQFLSCIKTHNLLSRYINMNTNLYNRHDYQRKIIPLKSEEDKYDCLKLLTSDNRHMSLCHNYYSEQHINLIIESSDYIVFHHFKQDVEEIVGFALVKVKQPMLDVLLLCAIPNNQQFGSMIAHSVYTLGILKKCKRIYTSPRTSRLRNTFINHGFASFRGTKDIDEVLVCRIVVPKYNITSNTRKIHKPQYHTKTYKKPIHISNSQDSIETNNVYEASNV